MIVIEEIAELGEELRDKIGGREAQPVNPHRQADKGIGTKEGG
jgi:hypothetical protein